MFEDGRDAGIECMVFDFLFLLAPNLYPCMNLTHFSQNFLEAADVKYLGTREIQQE